MKLLQSALAKIIDLTKTGSEDTKLDEVTMMLSIAVFILHSKSSLVSIPGLQYPCINHFRQCLQSDSNQVRLKCIQTMRQIFLNADLKGIVSFLKKSNFVFSYDLIYFFLFQLLLPIFIH